MEAVRTEYEYALPQLYKSGVAQEMADLAAIERQVPAERSGAYAIAGATLIDATGAPRASRFRGDRPQRPDRRCRVA